MSKTGRQWWEVKCAVVVTGEQMSSNKPLPPNARWNTETSTQTAFNLQEFNNIATFIVASYQCNVSVQKKQVRKTFIRVSKVSFVLCLHFLRKMLFTLQ